jgi:hypothetical protein
VSAPTRGYSWPPFEAGNLAAVRHGAWSPRIVDPLAEELVAAIESTVDWWRPCDRPGVMAWARTEARCQLLAEWLADRGGDIDDEDEVRPAADPLTRLEARAESLRSKLGLDPLSRARLGRDVAASQLDLARLWAAEGTDEDGAEPDDPDPECED